MTHIVRFATHPAQKSISELVRAPKRHFRQLKQLKIVNIVFFVVIVMGAFASVVAVIAFVMAVAAVVFTHVVIFFLSYIFS